MAGPVWLEQVSEAVQDNTAVDELVTEVSQDLNRSHLLVDLVLSQWQPYNRTCVVDQDGRAPRRDFLINGSLQHWYRK